MTIGARIVVFAALLGLLLSVSAFAQGLAPRRDVVFETTQTTSFGSSVFVVGDLPELGSNNNALAVKLAPVAYPFWRATISLPAGRSVTYRYIVRSDGPGQQDAAPSFTGANQSLIVADAPRATPSKALWLTWNIDRPVLWWRPASPTCCGSFVSRPMELFGPAVAGRMSEKQWFTWGFHVGGEAYDFYFTDASGNSRYPATGWYSTNLDGVFVQDGQLYSYVPAAGPSAARRDYGFSPVPSLYSPQLNQTRNYRVVVPRGYAEHPWKRYPVLYMHDGQNVFDQGSFGTWNALPTLANLQATGQMQEIIVVALDNIGDTRRSDYSKPGDNNGRADQYVSYIVNTVKPHIDSGYRTLTDAENTGVLGSSMGGVVSLYMGYDWNGSFRRIGAMSTAWWLVGNFTSYIKSEPARGNLRIAMDVGDSGSTSGGNNNDGYWDSFGVRDNFVQFSPSKYAMSGRYRFQVGFGQNHSEGAWASRLPGVLTFLFPSQGEPNVLLQTLFSPSWDVNADGTVDLEDVYAQAASPTDLNFDGAIDAQDTQALVRFLRRFEAGETTGR